MNNLPNSYLQELLKLPEEHPLFQRPHPFWRDCFRGRLPMDGLRTWGLDIYPIVTDFSRLYLHVAAKCNCEQTLTLLGETIYEETGSGKISESHPTLYRSFLQALEVSRDKLTNPSATPAGEAVWNHLWNITRDGSFLEGLALLGLALEGPLAKFSRLLERALHRQYGFESEALKFFKIHGVSDVKHGQLSARIVANLAVTTDLQTRVRDVLFRTWDLQHTHLDSLHRCHPAQ